jgi:hypothetical protein
MLVRSQDKKLQTSYTNGLWQVDCCKLYWLSLNHESYWLEFAAYSTEVKAIMVLDRMQQHYKDLSVTKLGGLNVHEISYTFEMPTDEELDKPTVQNIIDDLNKM